MRYTSEELMWSHDEDLLCKTLKLIPEPSLEHLMNELQATAVVCQFSYTMDDNGCL